MTLHFLTSFRCIMVFTIILLSKILLGTAFFVDDLTPYLLPFNYTCDPAEDCAGKEAGFAVPDADDCENYFICLQGGIPSAMPFTCDRGYFFDQTLGECSEEDIVGTCSNYCLMYPDGNCPTDCDYWPSNSGMHLSADAFNCSAYKICSTGQDIEQYCPANLPYFNGETCGSNINQCCKVCSPYCSTSEVTQIVDPCDCSSFYICTDQGPPNSVYRGTCDEGSYFDEAGQACVVGDCNSQCSSEQCSAV